MSDSLNLQTFFAFARFFLAKPNLSFKPGRKTVYFRDARDDRKFAMTREFSGSTGLELY